MRPLLPACAGLGASVVVLLGALAVRAEEPSSPARPALDLERLYQDVRHLVRRHYPDATAHRLDDRIHFEHDTRIFIVHEPLKTGEWQDPVEERGPRMHGVYGEIELRKGTYEGAGQVPQRYDKRYFVLSVLAPYSAKLDAHLYVHLKLPGTGRAPPGFEEQLLALLGGFERYADR